VQILAAAITQFKHLLLKNDSPISRRRRGDKTWRIAHGGCRRRAEPWREAAKGFLHIKGIEWAAVRLVYDSEPLKDWAAQRSRPLAIYENERPRSGWAEILLLTERLAPIPSLLPTGPAERALVFGLAHEICGEAQRSRLAQRRGRSQASC
jgi:hypothetical protein